MGRALPAKTGVPLLLDTDLATTIDFHIASTNFTKCLNEYINEVSAFYYFNSTKCEPDPIYAQAKFFAELNDGKLNLTNSHSSANYNTYIRSDVGYKLSKLDTLKDPAEAWIMGDDNKPEFNPNTSEYHAVNLSTGKRRWIPFTEDVVQEVKFKSQKLKRDWGMKDMNEEFMLYWKERFDKCHFKVKETYRQLVKDPRYDYFTEISDCMGVALARAKETIDCFTIPVADVRLNSTVPSVLHPVLADKVDRHTLSQTMEMSKKVNIRFRQNMANVKKLAYLEADTTNDQGAHGTVLVSDYNYINTMSEIAPQLIGKVADALGVSFRILTQVSIANNEQKVVTPSYDAVVENSKYQVNYLKDRVHTLQTASTTTSSRLQAFSNDVKDQG